MSDFLHRLWRNEIEWNNRLNGANDSRLGNCQPVCSDGGPSWIIMKEVTETTVESS